MNLDNFVHLCNQHHNQNHDNKHFRNSKKFPLASLQAISNSYLWPQAATDLVSITSFALKNKFLLEIPMI